MATFSDDFNRADGSPGSNWTTRQGSFAIVSNAIAGGAANSYMEVAAATADFSDNHESQITVTAKGNQDYIGPAVRVSASGCYAIKTDGRDIANNRIIKMTTTTLATLGTVNITVAVNDVLKLVADGTTITAYKNGVQVDSVTDSSFSTGQPGIWYDRSNVNATRGDSYSAADLATGPTITSLNSDNTAYHLQSDSALIGTGLSASQTFTLKGFACTVESASSSTSIKLTMPNFWTNNIKLGVTTELKVVD